MKKGLKKTIFCVVFAILFVGIYLYIGMVLMPKNLHDSGGEKYYSAVAYKYEKKNTVDVMLYGNSDLYSGFSPMELFKDSGVTAFGCGVAKQTVSGIFQQMKKSFKKQTPKVVVLETDCFFQPNSKFMGSGLYEIMPLIAPFIYHSRWKELEWKDFVTAPTLKGNSNFMKGYVFSNKIYDYSLKDGYMQDSDASPKKLNKSVVKDFSKIYKLCKKRGVELMLMTIPTPITWSNAKHNGVEELVREFNKKDKDYQIKYFDMNVESQDFDYATCFRDNGNHCNYKGAKIVTSRVGEFLQLNYELADRRGDDNYSEWDECLGKYDQYIEKNL